MNPAPEDMDQLTGLYSRRAGMAMLEQAVANHTQVALLLCDVDQFRTYNEFFGFPKGDEQLCRIALSIKEIAAPFPVSRVAGNTFMVILLGHSVEDARAMANRLISAQTPVKITLPGFPEVETCTLSVGFAHFPLQTLNAENLLHAADIAWLKVKRGGRLPDGTPYTGRNRAMTWGDFLDEFPHQSARFLNPDFEAPSI